MKDFTMIENMYNCLESHQQHLNPHSEDFSFFIELKTSVKSLLDSITMNKEKPLSFSLLKGITQNCVRFGNDSLDEYVESILKPTIDQKIKRRRKGVNSLVTLLFKTIYAPETAAASGLVHDLVANLKTSYLAQGQTPSSQPMNVWIFHRACQKFLDLDLIDKHGIFVPLTQAVRNHFQQSDSNTLKSEQAKERKALLDPYRPISFPGGDYADVITPLLNKFKRLTTKPTPCAANESYAAKADEGTPQKRRKNRK